MRQSPARAPSPTGGRPRQGELRWELGGGRPGDWECPSCGDHNFARNTNCRRCGEPRPSDAGGTATAVALMVESLR